MLRRRSGSGPARGGGDKLGLSSPGGAVREEEEGEEGEEGEELDGMYSHDAKDSTLDMSALTCSTHHRKVLLRAVTACQDPPLTQVSAAAGCC